MNPRYLIDGQRYLIDYNYLAQAQLYYKELDYHYVDAPWFVSEQAMNITVPYGIRCHGQEIPVASGEQSFLQLIMDKNLSPGIKHFCITPCLRRSDRYDDWHCQEFMKLELIWYFGHTMSIISDEVLKVYQTIINDAAGFFCKFLPIEICEITDEPRKGCITTNPKDIQWQGIELGSYGIRSAPEIGTWVYGTGVALPRLQMAAGGQLLKKLHELPQTHPGPVSPHN